MYLSWDESSRLPLISIKVYVFHIVPECHALIWRTQISNFTLWDEPMGWLQLPLLVHVIEDIFILKRVSRGPFKLGKPNLQNSTVFSIVGHSGSPSCIYSLRFFFFFFSTHWPEKFPKKEQKPCHCGKSLFRRTHRISVGPGRKTEIMLLQLRKCNKGNWLHEYRKVGRAKNVKWSNLEVSTHF